MNIPAGRAVLAWAAAFFVLHQAWVVIVARKVEAVVDVLTPYVMISASVAVLWALGAPRRALLAAVAAGTLYVQGRAAHMAANYINHTGVDSDVVRFWDERFGHIVGVLGWAGLLAAFCLAERATARSADASRPLLGVATVLIGWTAFTATIEGQTWWLELALTVAFVAWALRAPGRPVLRAVAAAFAIGAALIGVWAVWHGGVPQISTV